MRFIQSKLIIFSTWSCNSATYLMVDILSKNSVGNGHKLQDFSAHCQSEVSNNEAK